MDAISYSYADKQAKRIKKFINDPDSTSGVLTVPKVIASGESVTIPAGRVAILPDVQVDGTLNVLGDIFIPSGTANSKVVQKVASTDKAIPRFNGTTGDIQNSGVIIDNSNNIITKGSTGGSGLFISKSDNTDTLSAFGDRAQIVGGAKDTTTCIYSGTGIPIAFNMGSTEIARFDSVGNVGIGVSNPSSSLTVKDGITLIRQFGNTTTRPAVAPGVQKYGVHVGTDYYDDGFLRLSAGGGTGYAKSYIDLSGYSSVPDMNMNIVFGTANVERMRIDSNGNVGIGVTPSAWAAYKVIQTGYSGVLSGSNSVNELTIGSNFYNSSTGWKYINNGYASQQQFVNGTVYWNMAPSGTAGNAISWTNAMTLDSVGNLRIGPSDTGINSVVFTPNGDIQSVNNNIAYTKLKLNPGGGNVLIGTATDDGKHKVQVEGKIKSRNLNQNNYSVNQAIWYDDASLSADIQTSTEGSIAFSPILGGCTATTQGYLGHHILGGWRSGIGGWNGGHIGTFITPGGGSDSFSTTYYLLKDNGQIGWSGGTPTLVSLSDMRKKDKKEDLVNGLEKINTLTPFIGRYKEDITNKDKVFLSAQEVQKILPEAVSEDTDGFLQLSYIDLVPLLISAVKDLTKEVKMLKIKLENKDGN